MVLDAISNFVRGNANGSIDSTQTTIPVNDASIYPDPSTDGEYNVVIWAAGTNPRPDQDPDVEVLRVTARDTNNNELTVNRGQEGTAGASHPDGSAIHLSPTAKMFSDIENTFGTFYDDANDVLTSQVGTSSSPVSLVSTNDLSATNALVWEEDPNKPFEADNQSSVKFDLANDYDRIRIIPAGKHNGFDQLRVNGVSSQDYQIVDNADNNPTGATEWSLGGSTKFIDEIKLKTRSSGIIGLSVNQAGGVTSATVSGQVGESPPINSITFLDSGGSNQSIDVEVYGINLD